MRSRAPASQEGGSHHKPNWLAPWSQTPQLPELWENRFLLSKSPSLWNFVMATQVDWDKDSYRKDETYKYINKYWYTSWHDIGITVQLHVDSDQLHIIKCSCSWSLQPVKVYLCLAHLEKVFPLGDCLISQRHNRNSVDLINISSLLLFITWS